MAAADAATKTLVAVPGLTLSSLITKLNGKSRRRGVKEAGIETGSPETGGV